MGILVLTLFYLVLTYVALTAFVAGVFLRIFARENVFTKRKGIARFLFALIAVSLAFSALRHLRFILNPVPNWLIDVQDAGIYGEYLLPVLALLLIAFGFRGEEASRKKYLASGLGVVLSFLTASSGWAVKYMDGSSIPDVKGFFMGALTLHPQPVDTHPLFLIHYTLFLAFAAWLPFTGTNRKILAAALLILAILLIAAKPDPVLLPGRITDAARRYHYPTDYWLRNHGRILTETRDSSLGECWQCHKTSLCNSCHTYSGVRKVSEGHE